jgi:mono/diheme cytochrome c family protein
MVIVLTNMNPINVNRLVQLVPGIDLVLAGHGEELSDNQAVPPRPRVVYAGSQGKRLGEIRVFLGSERVANHVANHLFLDRRYSADAGMEALETAANVRINDYYRKLAQEKPAPAVVNVPAARRYVGADTCQGCHDEAYQAWQQSGHQHAIQTLIDGGQEYNPLCVNCHVTGFEVDNGFQNLTATPRFADVQCEACHGPAGAHLEDPAESYGATGESRCVICHTSENSPDFDYPSYWENVRH